MSYWSDEEEAEPREIELPTVIVTPPGPCVICGAPGQSHGCFKCGQPVCMNPDNYLADSTCGSWILDSWHDDAPQDNEFWCHKHVPGE